MKTSHLLESKGRSYGAGPFDTKEWILNQYAVVALSTLFGETRVSWTDSQRSASEIGAEARKKQLLADGITGMTTNGDLTVVVHNDPAVIDVQPGDTIRDRSNGAVVYVEDINRNEAGFPTIMGHQTTGATYTRTFQSVTEYAIQKLDDRSIPELLASLDVATDAERHAAMLWPRKALRLRVGRAPRKLDYYSTAFERDVWMQISSDAESLAEDCTAQIEHSKRGAPLATRNSIQARIDATARRLYNTLDGYRARREELAAGNRVDEVDEDDAQD